MPPKKDASTMSNAEIKAERPTLLTECEEKGQEIYTLLGTITYPENKAKVTAARLMLKDFRPLFKRLIDIDYQFTVNDNGALNSKLRKYDAKLKEVSQSLQEKSEELNAVQAKLDAVQAKLDDTNAKYFALQGEHAALRTAAGEAVSRSVDKLHEAAESDIPEYKEGADDIDPRWSKEIDAGYKYDFDEATGNYIIYNPADEAKTPIRKVERFGGGRTRRRNRQRRGRKSRR